MKKISKNSIFKGIKFTIDLALIFQFIGIILFFTSIFWLMDKSQFNIEKIENSYKATFSSPANSIMIVLAHPDLPENIKPIEKNFFWFSNLCRFINLIALILITLQLRCIFKSFCQEDFFNPINTIRIRKIAIIVFIWVIADFAIRLMLGTIIPDYLINSSFGISSFHNGIVRGLFALNLKILILSIIIYLLSIVFNYGNNIKEESSLTI